MSAPTRARAALLRKNCYIRIKVAAQLGLGVSLSAEEVWQMASDTAIATTAIVDAEREGWTWDESGALVRIEGPARM